MEKAEGATGLGRITREQIETKAALRFQTGGRRLWQSSTSEESGLPQDQKNEGV